VDLEKPGALLHVLRKRKKQAQEANGDQIEEEVSVALLGEFSCLAPGLRRFLLGRMFGLPPGLAGKLPFTVNEDLKLGVLQWRAYIQRRLAALPRDKDNKVDPHQAMLVYLDIIAMGQLFS
jgi:hypothetical protein